MKSAFAAAITGVHHLCRLHQRASQPASHCNLPGVSHQRGCDLRSCLQLLNFQFKLYFFRIITSVMATFLSISLLSNFENSSVSASELDSGSGTGNLALFLLGGFGIAEGRLVTVEDETLPLEVDGSLVDSG